MRRVSFTAMGNSCDKTSAKSTKVTRIETPKEDEKKRRMSGRQASHYGLFNKYALKFPRIRRSFTYVKKAFLKYCHEHKDKHADNEIPTGNLREVMVALGATQLSEEEITRLFNIADLDGSKTISFREFLICISLGYYLKERSEEEEKKLMEAHPEYEETKKGFQIVQQAFKDIDVDSGGTIDPDELKRALFSMGGQTSQDILEARFKELDFDGDGDIYFQEFMYGFAAWVGLMDEEEEEEEEEEKEKEGEKEK